MLMNNRIVIDNQRQKKNIMNYLLNIDSLQIFSINNITMND